MWDLEGLGHHWLYGPQCLQFATTIPTRRLFSTKLSTTLGTCAAKLAKTKAYMHTVTDRPCSCLQRRMLARHRSCQSLHIPPHLLPTQRAGKNEGIHAPVLANGLSSCLQGQMLVCTHFRQPLNEHGYPYTLLFMVSLMTSRYGAPRHAPTVSDKQLSWSSSVLRRLSTSTRRHFDMIIVRRQRRAHHFAALNRQRPSHHAFHGR